MKKIVFICALMYALFFGLHDSILYSAQLPVLTTTGKTRPQQTSKEKTSVSVAKIVLGRAGDISAVKAKPAGTIKKTAAVRKRGKASYYFTPLNEKITSKSAIIVDDKTGEILFAKSPDTPRQPASTIKVLTGLIAIKSLADNELVGVSRHASRMPRSKVYLSTKKHYKADDLINAVLVSSANDASVALAEKIAGSEDRFAKMMTLRAKLWGAKKTVCRTASGLTARGQQSTARDLAMIFRHAARDQEFVKRMAKVKVRTSYGKTLRNHNKALWQVDGAVAGKTGYTRAARQTYVGKFSRNGEAIIVAVMGSETMWDDVETLVEYGFDRQKTYLLSESTKKLAKLQQ